MRILVLNYEFPPLGGGASPVSYEIAKRYVLLGHQVSVVTMGFRDLPEFEEKDGMKIYRVQCWRNKKEMCTPWEQLSFLIKARSFFKKHLKTHHYNVNHTHFVIPTGELSCWLKKKYGIPFIITPHGSDIPGFNTDRFQFLHQFTPPFLRNIIKKSEKITVPSQYLKKLIDKKVMPLDKKGMVIPNGIDPRKYSPQPKEKIIFSSGRLLPRKGFQHLIKAVSHKNIGFEVHICGDGPMMENLKELTKKSATKVVLHGWLNNQSDEYKNLLERASIYCLVSEKENASIALLEGMSAGCTVITSDVAGCPETVGDAGFTVPYGNTEKLTEKLEFLTENPETLQKFSKKARKAIENKYSWANLITAYEKELKIAYKNSPQKSA